ncbi:hypothetical protein TNCV_1304771 [Trichonephila clavipes]|nr:hypothetical protein TNCV_1304771 [Trichonephila clavipes]
MPVTSQKKIKESKNSTSIIQGEIVMVDMLCHRIALTGDIEKMFRQILVNEDDVEFQRIFWREISEEPLKEYRLLTVTYGDSLCSIFVHCEQFRS